MYLANSRLCILRKYKDCYLDICFIYFNIYFHDHHQILLLDILYSLEIFIALISFVLSVN